MKTQLVYSQKMPPRRQFPEAAVLLYDSVLDTHSFFKSWRSGFAYSWPLTAGEKLKSIDAFQLLLKKISAKDIPQTQELTFVAVGGGSVGDFVGFLASTFLRGRNFVQIPSTWLSAIDSSHGGKNGLNLAGVKNQIGTIYPAGQVYLVKELLNSQPKALLTDAFGEAIKVAIINTPAVLSKLDHSNLYSLLPVLIRGKLKVVAKDPFEKSGHRRILNLGHTLGHVLESQLNISHGQAVKLGILFSATWSFHLGYLNNLNYKKIEMALGEETYGRLRLSLAALSPRQIKKHLVRDKKIISKTEVDFIFIQKIGKVFRKKVLFNQFLAEVKRQKQGH